MERHEINISRDNKRVSSSTTFAAKFPRTEFSSSPTVPHDIPSDTSLWTLAQASTHHAELPSAMPQPVTPILPPFPIAMIPLSPALASLPSLQTLERSTDFKPTTYPSPFADLSGKNTLLIELMVTLPHKGTVKTLIAQGKYLLKDKKGMTPLHYCVHRKGHGEFLELILQHAKENHNLDIDHLVTTLTPDSKHEQCYWTVAHEAVSRKNSKVLAMLINKNYSFNWLQGRLPENTVAGILHKKWLLCETEELLKDIQNPQEVERLRNALSVVAPLLIGKEKLVPLKALPASAAEPLGGRWATHARASSQPTSGATFSLSP